MHAHDQHWQTEEAARGLWLVAALRKELASRGLSRSHRVTRSSCMGRCGEGPTVVVYPDASHHVEPSNADVEAKLRELSLI